jgi:erythromycin esterase
MHDRGPTGTTPWARYELEIQVDPCASGVLFGVLHQGTGTAWFDSLAVQIVGDAPPAAERCGEPEPPAWLAWTREHAVPLRSLTSDDFADLRFLRGLVDGRRIVQLGESGHGVAEFDEVKVRLVRYLHQELGYDVIAFESGLFECFQAYRDVETLTPDALMRRCIFGVWHADEVLPLFEYIKETAPTHHPLILAGFDTQVSSRIGVASRPMLLERLLRPVDADFAAGAGALDSAFLELVRRGPDTRRALAEDRRLADSLTAAYQEVAAFIDRHADDLTRHAGGDVALVQVARQSAWSMARVVTQLRSGPGGAAVAARDSGMAANLDFLLERLYPDRKVIVWGHNYHLRHANEAVWPNPGRTMGGWVARRHRNRMYTVGLYMYQGRGALNSRRIYDIEAPWTGTVESVLGAADGDYLFLDLSQQVRTAGSEWLFRPIRIRQWGTANLDMVLRDQYDALLLIRHVRPPAYR